MGPAHRSRFRSRSLLRSSIVLRGLGHGTGRAEAFVLWGFECSHTGRVELLAGIGDFDEKISPGWRDEMYQSWWACKAIEAQITVRKCEQLFLVRPGRRGLLSAR